MLQVDAGLRLARTSRRVEPERSVIFAGACRIKRDGMVPYPGFKRKRVGWLCTANDDERLHVMKLLPGDGLEIREQGIARDHNSRSGVIEQEFVVGWLQQRIDGNRHGSDFDGRKKARGKFRRVEQQQKDSFLGPYIQLPESVSNPVHRLSELTVGDSAILTLNRNLLAAPFGDMAVHEITRRVKFLGKQKGRRGHEGNRLGKPQIPGGHRTGQIENRRFSEIRSEPWCERGDSNPHGFTRQILSLVRLPIPPLSHVVESNSYSF